MSAATTAATANKRMRLSLAETTKLTGWPPISLPFKSDRIGHSGPAISSADAAIIVQTT
jgi:hypothetical protein